MLAARAPATALTSGLGAGPDFVECPVARGVDGALVPAVCPSAARAPVAAEAVVGLLATGAVGGFDVGVGVVGFLTNRVGVSWELRRFESLTRTNEDTGQTIDGKLRLSFWRAHMAFVYRY